MSDRFAVCVEFVLRAEGGYVNDPNDPGGETKFGISRRAHPHEDIKGLTEARAAEIYRAQYWDRCGKDLPVGVDLVVFDSAVNQGVTRATKCLQKAVGVGTDGKLGPVTHQAAWDACRTPSHHRRVVREVALARLLHYTSIDGWRLYKVGWGRRLLDCLTEAMSAIP